MDPNTPATPAQPVTSPVTPNPGSNGSSGTKMALIVGGVVLLIVVGGLAVYRMSQKASLTPTTSNQPASSPSSEVQTAPVVANKTYSSANDAQMDKDLEDTDTSLSALDKDLLSASNTLNDQSGSLTE